jgi:hypothetical protein
MCGAGDVTALHRRRDWDQRQPGQFFGFRPRTTTRFTLAPQASHKRTSMDWLAGLTSGFGAACRTGFVGSVNCPLRGKTTAEVVNGFRAGELIATQSKSPFGPPNYLLSGFDFLLTDRHLSAWIHRPAFSLDLS